MISVSRVDRGPLPQSATIRSTTTSSPPERFKARRFWTPGPQTTETNRNLFISLPMGRTDAADLMQGNSAVAPPGGDPSRRKAGGE